jgi:ribosome-binding factor A
MGRQVFVNVLKVDISGDFMNVKAFIDIFGAGDKYVDDLLRKLNGDLSGQIRNAVAKMIRMKFVPKITFCRDEFEHGQKILGLLEKIRMESEG